MKQTIGLPLAGLVPLCWLAMADTAAASAVNGPEEIGGPGIGYLIWVIVALALVVGLIILLIKWLSVRNRGWNGNRALRSLGGIPLGQNKSLQVVELSGRIYVVGVGDSIALLDKIDDPSAVAEVLEAFEQQHGKQWNTPSISDFVSRFRNRGSGRQPNEEQWQEVSSFEEMLQNKMKRQSDQKQKMEDLLKEQNQNDRLLDE